jgi:glycosyltransferase involved in cell wall biosynthesis
MKILHAVSGWPPEQVGEIEPYVQRLARAQIAAGHGVAVAAGSGSLRYAGRFRRSAEAVDGIEVHRISAGGTLPERWDHGAAPRVARAFGALLAEVAPDVLHVHHWARLSRSLVRRAARAGVPSVLSLHDLSATCPRVSRVRPDDPCCELPAGIESCRGCVPHESWVSPGLVAEEIEHYYADLHGELGRAAVRVCASRAHARLLARHTDSGERSFAVVPLPSSVEWSVERAPETPWSPNCGRPLRLAHWGALGAEAGTDVLLTALRRLGRPAEIELQVWGAPGERLERELAALGERMAVTLRPLGVGAAGAFELRELRADLGVLPFLRHEAHGTALDAALALRMPVLVSDRGALAERAGGGGLVAPAGSAAGLVERLADVLDGRVRLADLRAALPAGRTVEEHWKELEPVYARAMAHGAGPAADDAEGDGPDDRECWERLARAYEDLCRDAVGLRGAAEREVLELRRGASNAFARMHEGLARSSGATAELRALKVRLATRITEVRELRARAAEHTAMIREHEVRDAKRAEAIQKLEATLLAHLAKAMELEGLLTRKESEHAERSAETRAAEERVRKLERENRLALPLVWPARGLLWIWDRLKT